MEFEWKWSGILGIIMIGIGILNTVLAFVLLDPILSFPIIGYSSVMVITLVFCVLYGVIGALILFASLKDIKNLSLAGLMAGIIIFSFALISSFLILQGTVDIKPYAVPWFTLAHEGLSDLPEISQLILYAFYGLPIYDIIPSIGLFYWINLVSSIASMVIAFLAYLWFEKLFEV
ncbi:MAG: hypothetical protein HWN67_09490 [Candidatus Helarchaeota archaeon]|nr:hypothetical protein [Candidatus Helarchaeota archaeon]